MVDFTVKTDEHMARAAARAWFRHMFFTYRAKIFALSATFLAFATAFCFFYFGLSWLSGFFAVFLIFNVLYFPIFHFAFQNAAAKFVRNTPEAHYSVTDSQITCATAKQTLSIPLTQLQALLPHNDFWLVVFSRYGFWCLPKSQTPDEVIDILQRARPNNSFKPTPLRGAA